MIALINKVQYIPKLPIFKVDRIYPYFSPMYTYPEHRAPISELSRFGFKFLTINQVVRE